MTSTRARSVDSADVIVVGAGPAGSTLAMRLVRLGARVLLLDRARFPRDKPCAEYLNHGATRILHSLGVIDDLMTAGAVQLSGMNIRSPGGRWIRGEFCGELGEEWRSERRGELRVESRSEPRGELSGNLGGTPALSLRRLLLDAILLNHARSAGVDVRERMRVHSLAYDSAGRVTGVAALDAHAETVYLHAPLVVAADGLNSTVASRLGLTHRSGWLRRVAFVGHFEGVSGIGSTGEMHVEADGFMGIADVGHGESVAALVVPQAAAREAAGRVNDFLLQWISRHPQLARRYARGRLTGKVLAVGPFASRATRAWAPGAALVGDSAEYLDPFTGEGIWSALRGAELLAPHAEAAARAAANGMPHEADAALQKYDAELRAEFRARRMVEHTIAAIVARPWLMNRAARSLSSRQHDANTLLAVTGARLPASAVLRPGFIGRLVFRC